MNSRQGTGISNSSAIRIADTTHPSRRTIPSQHQLPTSQTPSSPLRHVDDFSRWSRLLPSAKIRFTIALLRGVRNVRVKTVLLMTFAESMGVCGLFETSTEEGCSWIVSVSVVPRSTATVRMWIHCPSDAAGYAEVSRGAAILASDDGGGGDGGALMTGVMSVCTTDSTGSVGMHAMSCFNGVKIAPTALGGMAMMTWSKVRWWDDFVAVDSQDIKAPPGGLLLRGVTDVTRDPRLIFRPLDSFPWTSWTPAETR